MKRTVVLLRRYGGADAALLLMLSLSLLSGCSNGGDGGDAGKEAIGIHGLEASEYVALKKANKGTGNFKKALLKERLEKLKEQGAVVETTPSGQRTNRPR
jgi:hypothetical protein